MKHTGSLVITAANREHFAELSEVTGDLRIRADASLPLLTTVVGYLDIGADASLPLLTTVGGYLGIRADASLPLLTTVGGFLGIRAGASLPPLTMLHGQKGTLIAVSGYGLWLSDSGDYYSGCRGPLTKDAALKHWDRTDERAVLFAAAIKHQHLSLA